MRLFDFYAALADEEEKAEKQKRKMDRIARQAEAKQRFAKGRHFK